jgi:hypothetical protein
MMWFTLPYPVVHTKPASYFQPRPNIYKLTMPKTALTNTDNDQKEAYPKAMDEQLTDYLTFIDTITAAGNNGTMSKRDALDQAHATIREKIFAATQQTIGFSNPQTARHP